MNAWTGKGVILAVLATRLPLDDTWLLVAIMASTFGTLGLAIESGVIGNPLTPRKHGRGNQ